VLFPMPLEVLLYRGTTSWLSQENLRHT